MKNKWIWITLCILLIFGGIARGVMLHLQVKTEIVSISEDRDKYKGIARTYYLDKAVAEMQIKNRNEEIVKLRDEIFALKQTNSFDEVWEDFK